MLLTLAVAILLGIITTRARKQKAAVQSLRDAGAEVSYDYEQGADGEMLDQPQPPGPGWLREWLGIDYVARVRGVRLWMNYYLLQPKFNNGKTPAEECIAPKALSIDPITSLPDIVELDLSAIPTSGVELAKLRSLQRIESLDLSGMWIDDNDLAVLTEMPRLRKLRLRDCWLGDAAYERLREFRLLEELDLSRAGVNDARLLQLGSLSRLQSLELAGNDVTDTGLAALESMRNLRTLDLSYTFVTGPDSRPGGVPCHFARLPFAIRSWTIAAWNKLHGWRRWNALT